MNVNYTDAVMEAWTQTSVKSGFSEASSAVSSRSGSTHSMSPNDKLHKRDGFPSRQPLKTGGLPGKRRPKTNAQRHIDNSKLKVLNSNNNNIFRDCAKSNTDGVSLTLKIPNSFEATDVHHVAPEPLKVRSHSGEIVNESRLDEASRVSPGAQQADIFHDRGQESYPQTTHSTYVTVQGFQQKRGFHGRPPLKNTGGTRGDHSNLRQLNTSGSGSMRRPSPTSSTPEVDAPHILLEGSAGRGRSETLFLFSSTSGKENSNSQLLLSGAGIDMDRVSRRAGDPAAILEGKKLTSSKLVTSRSDSKVTLKREESRLGGPSSGHLRYCDACAIDNIRQWLRGSASSSAAQDWKTFYEPLQLIKTVGPEEFYRVRSAPLMTGSGSNQVYMVGKDSKMADASGSSQRRQAASVHTVTVPKKGLIKLTGLAYEFDNPGYYDNRKEHHSRLELQRHRDKVYGGALPPPPSDLFRGPLIRNKSIIKQVKHGQKRLQAEREQLEAKHRTESALYRTFVGGLLEFEMPEVPNLNSNLQKFLVWQDPRLFRHTYDRNNNNNHTRNSHNTNTTSPDPQLHREKSRSASFTQPQAGSQMTPRSVKSEQASPHSPDPSVIPRSGSTTDLYIPSPLHSPRVAFVTTQFLQNKLLAAAPEAGHSKSKANHAPASKRRGHACPNDDPRGELQPRRVGVVEKMGVGKGVEFDEDELYHAMTEYGLYQELGKSNGLYINKADDKNKSSKSLVLPELAPI